MHSCVLSHAFNVTLQNVTVNRRIMPLVAAEMGFHVEAVWQSGGVRFGKPSKNAGVSSSSARISAENRGAV
jgi:hypothetical protein